MILIDGASAFDDAEPVTNLACRLYRIESGLAPLPTVEQLTDVFRARGHSRNRPTR
jgi:hypothetical protein